MKLHCEGSVFPFASNINLEDSLKLRNLLQNIKGNNNFKLLIVNEKHIETEDVIIDNLIITNIIGPYLEENGEKMFVINCSYEVPIEYHNQWINIFKKFHL